MKKAFFALTFMLSCQTTQPISEPPAAQARDRQNEQPVAKSNVKSTAKPTAKVYPTVHHIQAGCSKSDIKVINNGNHGFFDKANSCATQNLADAEKTTACLHGDYPSLSATCVRCFGEDAHCGASNCLSHCLFNRKSEGCLSCIEQYCGEDGTGFSLERCTGIKKENLPPVN